MMFANLCEQTHSKFVVGRCPWCGSEIAEGDSVPISWERIRFEIEVLIATEDKLNPLTDVQIVEILTARRQHIAERTVVKFRRRAGIPSANDRRTRIE